MSFCIFSKNTQFYETETYAPLCDTQSAQGVLPPSYENVMAAEKAILEKYAKICTSTTCCEHSNLNRSNLEPSNNNDSNISEDAHTIHDSEMVCFFFLFFFKSNTHVYK